MSRISPVSRLTRIVTPVAIVVVVASCGGGGGDGTTTPPGTVARVEITAPSPTMEIRQNMQTTVRYCDASSSQLAGRTLAYSTSNSSIATISASGLVTAAGPGSVTIIATVDGVQGNLLLNVTQVPVFFISITALNPTVRQGETLTLSAQPQNAVGQPLTGRNITWSSADPSRATITQGGVVAGVSPGTVHIRAETEGRIDSVNLRVRSLITPSITGTSSVTLVPGGVGAITGTNFGTSVTDNEVIINGAAAAVTSANSTSVTFTVPAKSLLPCTATGPAQVALVANGDTALTTMWLKVATERTLSVGEALLLTADADLVCNEFLGSGGKYLITAFNYATDAGQRTSFQLTGSGAGTVATVAEVAAAAMVPTAVPDDPMSKH